MIHRVLFTHTCMFAHPPNGKTPSTLSPQVYAIWPPSLPSGPLTVPCSLPPAPLASSECSPLPYSPRHKTQPCGALPSPPLLPNKCLNKCVSVMHQPGVLLYPTGHKPRQAASPPLHLHSPPSIHSIHVAPPIWTCHEAPAPLCEWLHCVNSSEWLHSVSCSDWLSSCSSCVAMKAARSCGLALASNSSSTYTRTDKAHMQSTHIIRQSPP